MSTNGKLIYPELSYVLMGILYEVHNKLGTKYQEKHYQKAVEIRLKDLNIEYQREVMIEPSFGSEKLGKFFVDFIVDAKVLLEIKKIWKITKDDIGQVLRYLRASGLKLGIIANFKHRRLESRRVVL